MENLKFEEFNLSKNIKKALEEIGYLEATPIQSQSIPIILEGKDLIGQSQTGTGKTASFGLPIIEKIDNSQNKLQAIVLCPTRELAIQITEELRKFTKYEEGAKCLAVYGGESIERQITALKKGVKIVVGTPGRVMDHMRRKTIKLENIDTVVLDEADEMLNMGFEEDINEILSKTPIERQTILFSATMNTRILNISKKYLRDPEKVKIKAKELTVDRIDQKYLEVKNALRDEITMRLIDVNNPKKAVIFCNTKRKVDNLIETLKQKGYSSEALHGDVRQEQRQRIMNKLKKGEFKILVATDVVARGIDVEELELVINYDVPQEAEYYVHRIGRTGRNGSYGKAVTFIVGKEKNKLREIENYAKTKIPKGEMPTMEEIAKLRSQKVLDKIQKVIDGKKYAKNDINKGILDSLLETNKAEDVMMSLLEMLHENQNVKAEKSNQSFGKNEMVKLFITVGKKDGIKNKDIVGSIASNTIANGDSIGRIKILETYSFVEVVGEYVDEVVKSMKDKDIKGRKCNIEVANS